MKKCKQGYYYCYTEKKCKKIPMGYHIGARGYLAKDNDNDNESEDTTKNGNGDGNGSNGNGGGTVSEEGLRDWFGKSKSKDGKGGWVNVVTGGTCASDEPGEGTPKCVSSAKRASMTKAERLSAQRRKKKADPGQQQKSGAAKPTYVSTDSKKKMKKEEVEVEVTEAKDKKGKGSGSKDACYHKVKSRYSVWPSAYASGALVKCRKVGAANWGNKSEEVETTGLGEGKIADRLRQMNKAAKERWDTEGEKAKKDAYKALDKVKSNQARMERGLTEGTQFSNWRDDFKAMEYEFIDLIKPEPLVAEASFEIGHTSADVRKAEKNEKIRKLAQQGSTEGERRAAQRKAGTSLPSFEKEDADLDQMKKDAKSNRDRAAKLKDRNVTRGSAALAARAVERDVKKAAKTGPQQYPNPGKGVKKIEKPKPTHTKTGVMRVEEVESIDEAGKKCWKGYKKAGTQKLFGKTYNRCVKENEEVVDEMISTSGIRVPNQGEVKARKEKTEKKKLPKGYVGFVDEKGRGRIVDGKKVYEDFEKEVPSGDIKKLVKKAVKRIDQNVSGHVDNKDKSMGEYGEFVPSPDGKSKIVTSVKKESISNWRKEIEEGAAWTKKSGKSESGGLNEKGRKSYERENPGSDLKAPSKKVGNPRRKSFCARMKGMKKKLTSSKTANDPDSRINKSLRAWNC